MKQYPFSIPLGVLFSLQNITFYVKRDTWDISYKIKLEKEQHERACAAMAERTARNATYNKMYGTGR